MKPMRRAIAVVVAVFATIALVPTTTATASGAASPQHNAASRHQKASKPSYVALGDSYSAGSGALPPTDACLRSAAAFPVLLAKLGRLELTHAACGGATMAQVASTQLAALSKSTDFVTVQAGGNDIGFVPVFAACATLADEDCWAPLAAANAYLDTTFVKDAGALYKAIKKKAPKAKLIVVGYPRLFNGTNCSTNVYYSPTDRPAEHPARAGRQEGPRGLRQPHQGVQGPCLVRQGVLDHPARGPDRVPPHRPGPGARPVARGGAQIPLIRPAPTPAFA